MVSRSRPSRLGSASRPVRDALVDGLSRDYGVHAHEKWRGAFWRLLSLVDLFSHRTGEPAHPVFLKLRFPAYWHYDLLAGLRTLQAADALGDRRAADALALLESKRLSDGTWRTQGRWWKRPGSADGNIEAVDWGAAANVVLTEQAVSVLRAAGRL